MTSTPERRAELIAAAAAQALTPEERIELDRERQFDPTIDLEIDELRALIGTVSAAVPRWDASGPSAGLRDRIGGIGGMADGSDGAAAGSTAARSSFPPPSPVSLPSGRESVSRAGGGRSSRRRWLPVVVAAAACLVLGFGVGALLDPRGPAESAAGPALGEPGELGARELVDFVDAPQGVSVDGSVVAHTWGTETILEIEGLTVGESYQLVFIDDEGNPQSSGSFVGSTAVIDCRMNVATLRPDAVALEIRDAAGATVTAAELPPTQT